MPRSITGTFLVAAPALFSLNCGNLEAVATEPAYYSPSILRYTDHVYSPTVRTVQLFKTGFELSAPIIELGSEGSLTLRWDDLQANTENLSFTVQHCTADWGPSDLMSGQYLTGAMSDVVPVGDQSYNTLQPFIQYEIEVPNERMRIQRSGNYLLKVFRGNDEEDLVITRRFLVAEQRLRIDARVVATRNVELRDAAQQVDLSIQHPGLSIPDPFGDVQVCMLQNMRWDDARTGFTPRFVRDQELVYDYPDKGLFMGANEFRNFDMKDLRYASQQVARITPGIGAGVHEVFLAPAIKRNIRVYDNERDINGRYLVRNDVVDGDPLGADYALVHFQLPMPAKLGEEVFVYGAISDLQCRKEYRMTWDPERSAYQASLLLKQGFIDFTFATLAPGSEIPDLTTIEGSHFQTENDYLVLVYLRDHQQRYDRLVGARFVNSVRG